MQMIIHHLNLELPTEVKEQMKLEMDGDHFIGDIV